MGRVLAAEWMKLRRTWVMWLTLLGPVAMVFCQVVNYGLRAEYLLPRGWNGEQGLFFWVFALLPLTLMVGSMLTSAVAAGHEHDSDGWKQLLALPLPRFVWVVGKAVWLMMLLLFAGGLTVLCIGGFGLVAGLPAPVPWADLTRLVFWPLIATLPFLALQLWLSLVRRNQALPVTVGGVGALLGPYLAFRRDLHLHWWIWSWPNHAYPFTEGAAQWVGISLIVFPLIIVAASVHVSLREFR
ncbi:ABC transporter permease [Staphylospora marina]|uniref:ABC transporter permease n=1 Tax=Staphylospora marina TaxID=2490858 RepID=UPI000F5BE531|nr:ABC transporter permease [Staphylospora marina]